MASARFQWRGESYRLESSTWLFWGGARLIQRPADDDDFRMTPDDALFCQYAVRAGFDPSETVEAPQDLMACQTFLEQRGHQVWTVHQALGVVRETPDTDLSAQLMTCLQHWFFISKY